ncbi:hypothetical protein CMI47_11065 [Candidatus Pacearchaeota archaeon]|nr:hypothetical protein [Candidatus Pacearchaeota archaeon]|tara:strand:+ start:651 stop:1610 length:960 start_codon:yes stop_codon:yes gene_type:complete
MGNKAVTIDKVEAVSPLRTSTGFHELNWMYGHSDHVGEEIMGPWKSWGLPHGAVQLCAGAQGTGKTKLWMLISSEFNSWWRVLVIQQEMPLGMFKGQYLEDMVTRPDIFHILSDPLTEDPDLDHHIDEIIRIQPQLVVVDSVSMYENMQIKKNAQRVAKAYQHAASMTNAHIVLIGHLTSNGDTAGSRVLPHLVDIETKLQRNKENPEIIEFAVGTKNRLGPSGRTVLMEHNAKTMKILSRQFLEDAVYQHDRDMKPVEKGTWMYYDGDGNLLPEYLGTQAEPDIVQGPKECWTFWSTPSPAAPTAPTAPKKKGWRFFP